VTQGPAVIDRFTDTFARYIDSGFGLVHGEVAWLASTLIAIDVTLAGLFWAMSAQGEDVVARLIRKTLFIGAFAFLIGNWSTLARLVFESFSGLGLKASGATLSATDFLHPGKLAQSGIDAAKPILTAVSKMTGFPKVFDHLVQVVVLLIAWVVVMASFLVLAIQLFVTLIEFKITTLAGFVLVPFGLFNRTAFLAERTLGAVMASGVKVLVLAVIVGIGSKLFGEIASGFPADPTIDDALTVMIGSLTLLGLGIFGPGIAAGLGSGAPQLGAGAVIGTGLAVGGTGMALGAAVGAVAGAAGGAAGAGAKALAGAVLSSGRSGPSKLEAMSSASKGGGGSSGAGSASGGGSPLRPGPSGSGSSGAGSSSSGSSGGAGKGGRSDSASRSGADTAGGAGEGGGSAPSASEHAGGSAAESGRQAGAEQPGWAKRLQHRQGLHQGATTAAHALRSGDHGGAGSSLDLSQE